MKHKAIDNTKLGIFVIAGILFLVFTLYMIGKNRNLLGKTFVLHASVTNVSGLVPGNNVRFKGIDVGTVKKITLENDTIIRVTMVIDENMKPFIRKNAIVSIGTDGLMGNRVLNITSQPGKSEPVEQDDILLSRRSVETEEMIRTLSRTNENMAKISGNLYDMTEKLNGSETLWALLSDTVVTQDIKSGVKSFRAAGANAASLTRKGNEVMMRLDRGKGIVNQLFTDTALTVDLSEAITNLKQAGKNSSAITNDLQLALTDVRQGKGTAGLILSDSAMREKLLQTMTSVEQGTYRFNQNMEALKHNFLFRKYFRKLGKQKKDSLALRQ
ncbi:MAG TPA: MlaD family protein [Cyclobacteriaceae bacterium]|nr:MlaD family protein [Cyclobacteriaceae bacterium]